MEWGEYICTEFCRFLFGSLSHWPASNEARTWKINNRAWFFIFPVIYTGTISYFEILRKKILSMLHKVKFTAGYSKTHLLPPKNNLFCSNKTITNKRRSCEFKSQIASKFNLVLINANKLMYFHRIINRNKNHKILGGNKWVFCNQRWIALYFVN